jgi:cytosine/uracil/thiamine/allantoin permease
MKSESPQYFKDIRKVALWLSTVCTITLAVQATPYVDLPTSLWRVVSYVLVASVAIAAMTNVTTKDKSLSSK